jgi:hypothetical protein
MLKSSLSSFEEECAVVPGSKIVFTYLDLDKPVEIQRLEFKSMIYISQSDLIIFLRDCYENRGPIPSFILGSIMQSSVMNVNIQNLIKALSASTIGSWGIVLPIRS